MGPGANVLLTVTATGFGTLSYQWQFNGAGVAGATGTSLTLSSVQPTNAGSYTVVVTNTLGSGTSAVAVLTVLGTPADHGSTDKPERCGRWKRQFHRHCFRDAAAQLPVAVQRGGRLRRHRHKPDAGECPNQQRRQLPGGGDQQRGLGHQRGGEPHRGSGLPTGFPKCRRGGAG